MLYLDVMQKLGGIVIDEDKRGKWVAFFCTESSLQIYLEVQYMLVTGIVDRIVRIDDDFYDEQTRNSNRD